MSEHGNGIERRTVLGCAAGITVVPRHVLGAGKKPPSDTINIAGIRA